MKGITAQEFLRLAEGKLTAKQRQRVEDNGFDCYTITEEETLEVKEGKSHFGSGDYLAYYRVTGGLKKEEFLSGKRDSFTSVATYNLQLKKGTVVSYRETDYIRTLRVFNSLIVICI